MALMMQEKLSDEIMETVKDRKEDLFPLSGEIRYACNCPDCPDMCKHVSAVMYGIGARLDEQPELLFRFFPKCLLASQVKTAIWSMLFTQVFKSQTESKS